MDSEATNGGTLEHWTPEEVKAAFAKDEIVLIDVRTPQEYSFERIDGALLAPMHSFDPAHMPSQDGKPIVFHCGSGIRSAKVAKQYLDAGNAKIAHMSGGMGTWKEAGFDYIGTNMATGAPETTRKS